MRFLFIADGPLLPDMHGTDKVGTDRFFDLLDGRFISR
jgi:hypothetical protein